MADLDEAVRLAPADAEVHQLRGDMLASLDRPSEARAAYSRAAELDGARAAQLRRAIAGLDEILAERRREEERQRVAEEARRRQRVAELQEGLRKLGRLFEPADGEFTTGTRFALARFQGDTGVRGDPLSDEVLAAIEAEVAAREAEQRRRFAQDKEPPRLRAPENVAYADEQRAAVLEGEVQDDSGFVTLTLDGEPLEVGVDGRFRTLVRLAADERRELTLVARDRAGNEVPHRVMAARIFGRTATVAELPRLDINRMRRARANPDAVAIVIGVEQYERLSPAKYAAADGRAFVDYALYALGAPQRNVAYLLDHDATAIEVEDRIIAHLKAAGRPGASDVYLFFSGHGFAQKDRVPRFLAHNFRKTSVARTSLAQDELLELVGEFRPRSITLFADARFSGSSREGELLLAEAKLLTVEIEKEAGAAEAAIMTSSSGADLSKAIETATVRHGAFSYMLMRGLEGPADANDDRQITLGELYEYVRAEVPRYAETPNGPQIPWYNMASPDRVLVTFE